METIGDLAGLIAAELLGHPDGPGEAIRSFAWNVEEAVGRRLERPYPVPRLGADGQRFSELAEIMAVVVIESSGDMAKFDGSATQVGPRRNDWPDGTNFAFVVNLGAVAQAMARTSNHDHATLLAEALGAVGGSVVMSDGREMRGDAI